MTVQSLANKGSMMSVSKILVLAFSHLRSNSEPSSLCPSLLHELSNAVHDPVHMWRTHWKGQEQENNPASHYWWYWKVLRCQNWRTSWKSKMTWMNFWDSQALWEWSKLLLCWLYQKPWLDWQRQHRGPYASQCISPGLNEKTIMSRVLWPVWTHSRTQVEIP